MTNPGRISKKQFVFNAFLLWTFWVFVYAAVLYAGSEIPSFFIAFITSAQSNYLFALLSISLWYLCLRIPFGRLPFGLFAVVHIFFATFFSVFWLFLLYGLWYLLMGKIVFEVVHFNQIIGWQVTHGMLFYFLVIGINYTIIYYRNFREKELAEAELRLLSREAELKVLKLQLNPHFLFNSLNSINALVTDNPELARKMLTKLAEVLRMALDSHDKQLVPLQFELDFTGAYLEIEQIRFGERMNYQEQIEPSTLTRFVPSMMLQPLLENAVKHGIANRLQGGTIQLRIQPAAETLDIQVTNQFNPTDSIDVNRLFTNGTGLSNLKQRLDRLYGERYQIRVDTEEPGEFCIRLIIPGQDKPEIKTGNR